MSFGRAKAVIVISDDPEKFRKGIYKVHFLHDLALFKPSLWSNSKVVELIHTTRYDNWIVKQPDTNTEFAMVKQNDLEFLNRNYFKAVVSVDNDSCVVVY